MSQPEREKMIVLQKRSNPWNSRLTLLQELSKPWNKKYASNFRNREQTQ